MRLMSFMHTTEALLDRTKDVTRRLGWRTLKPGTLLRACAKVRGRKPGEPIVELDVIRVVSVRSEPLNAITAEDVARERLPGIETPAQFVAAFTDAMGCAPDTVVQRIEFEYPTAKAYRAKTRTGRRAPRGG